MNMTGWRFRHWWWAVVLPMVILIWPYFHPGVPYTHDGENHLARFANYKVAVREGQFPPRFAPNLLNHYGYPAFNYNYPLLNIISLPFSALGIHYEMTFKIMMAAGAVLGAWGVYRWLTLYPSKQLARWVAVGAYLTTPFLANLVYVRGNIGELWALALFPWLLWLSRVTAQGQRLFWWQSVPLLTAFFLSHNVSVLFGVGLWLLYSAFEFGKNSHYWKRWMRPTFLSLLMSAWFWLPALAEKHLIILDNASLSNTYAQHFVEPLQLLFSPLQFGFSYSSAVDTLSFSIGIMGFLGLILMTLWSIKYFRSHEARSWRFLIMVSWLLLMAQLSWTSGVWKTLPLANFIQFPWRLTLFFVVFSLPLIAASATLHKKIVWLLLSVFFFQLLTVWRLQPADYLHKEIIDYDLFSQSTSTLNENLPKTFTYQGIADWSPEPRVLDGEADILVAHWTGSDRRYTVSAKIDSTLVEPTAYFAGWETTVNGEPIQYLNTTIADGRISYRLTAGEYQVETRFTQNTWPRMIGNLASALAFGFWLWLLWQENPQFFKRS